MGKEYIAEQFKTVLPYKGDTCVLPVAQIGTPQSIAFDASPHSALPHNKKKFSNYFNSTRPSYCYGA